MTWWMCFVIHNLMLFTFVMRDHSWLVSSLAFIVTHGPGAATQPVTSQTVQMHTSLLPLLPPQCWTLFYSCTLFFVGFFFLTETCEHSVGLIFKFINVSLGWNTAIHLASHSIQSDVICKFSMAILSFLGLSKSWPEEGILISFLWWL